MTTAERLTVLNGGPSREERDDRLSAGADDLASGRSNQSILANERTLLTVAGALMSGGVCAILLGWFGASRSTLVEEQVPYLISGGLLGVALATVGALVFFSHWLTVAVREARAHEAARRQDHAELLDVLRTVATALEAQEVNRDDRARRSRAQRPLRPAPRSS